MAFGDIVGAGEDQLSWSKGIPRKLDPHRAEKSYQPCHQEWRTGGCCV